MRAYYFSFVVMTERPTKWEIKGADGSHTQVTHVNSHRVNAKYLGGTKLQTKFKTVVIN